MGIQPLKILGVMKSCSEICDLRRLQEVREVRAGCTLRALCQAQTEAFLMCWQPETRGALESAELLQVSAPS